MRKCPVPPLLDGLYSESMEMLTWLFAGSDNTGLMKKVRPTSVALLVTSIERSDTLYAEGEVAKPELYDYGGNSI